MVSSTNRGVIGGLRGAPHWEQECEAGKGCSAGHESSIEKCIVDIAVREKIRPKGKRRLNARWTTTLEK
jgi:hypothetical protein